MVRLEKDGVFSTSEGWMSLYCDEFDFPTTKVQMYGIFKCNRPGEL